MSTPDDDITARIDFTRTWRRLQAAPLSEKWPRNRRGEKRLKISRAAAERFMAAGLADPGDFIILEPRT